MVTSSKTVYIVMNTATGKAVQNITFAGKKRIVYCANPEWAMHLGSEAAGMHTLESLRKHFPDARLSVVKATFTTSVALG